MVVLDRFCGRARGILLIFLHDAGLIEKNDRVVDLSGADLSGADLSGAYLQHARLTGNLSGANISDANLLGADLSGADLRVNVEPATVIDGPAAGRLCQAETLYQATGLIGLFLEGVQKKCPSLLENPTGRE